MKKRAKLITAAVSLGALMTVGGTLAWFTDSETATNTVTTGYVDLEIKEHIPTNHGEEGYTVKVIKDEFGNDSGIVYGDITPGVTIQKDPSIFYKGSVDAYVRYRVVVEPAGDDVDPGFNYNELLSHLEFRKNGEIINVNEHNNDGDWIYVENKVQAGTDDHPTKIISPIFDEIVIGENVGNEIANQSLDIRIEAEAIQAANLDSNGDGTTNRDEIKAAFGESENEDGRVDDFINDSEIAVTQ